MLIRPKELKQTPAWHKVAAGVRYQHKAAPLEVERKNNQRNCEVISERRIVLGCRQWAIPHGAKSDYVAVIKFA